MTEKSIGVHTWGPEDRVTAAKLGVAPAGIFVARVGGRVVAASLAISTEADAKWYRRVSPVRATITNVPTSVTINAEATEVTTLQDRLPSIAHSCLRLWTKNGSINYIPNDVYSTFVDYVASQVKPSIAVVHAGEEAGVTYTGASFHPSLTPPVSSSLRVSFDGWGNVPTVSNPVAFSYSSPALGSFYPPAAVLASIRVYPADTYRVEASGELVISALVPFYSFGANARVLGAGDADSPNGVNGVTVTEVSRSSVIAETAVVSLTKASIAPACTLPMKVTLGTIPWADVLAGSASIPATLDGVLFGTQISLPCTYHFSNATQCYLSIPEYSSLSPRLLALYKSSNAATLNSDTAVKQGSTTEEYVLGVSYLPPCRYDTGVLHSPSMETVQVDTGGGVTKTYEVAKSFYIGLENVVPVFGSKSALICTDYANWAYWEPIVAQSTIPVDSSFRNRSSLPHSFIDAASNLSYQIASSGAFFVFQEVSTSSTLHHTGTYAYDTLLPVAPDRDVRPNNMATRVHPYAITAYAKDISVSWPPGNTATNKVLEYTNDTKASWSCGLSQKLLPVSDTCVIDKATSRGSGSIFGVSVAKQKMTYTWSTATSPGVRAMVSDSEGVSGFSVLCSRQRKPEYLPVTASVARIDCGPLGDVIQRTVPYSLPYSIRIAVKGGIGARVLGGEQSSGAKLAHLDGLYVYEGIGAPTVSKARMLASFTPTIPVRTAVEENDVHIRVPSVRSVYSRVYAVDFTDHIITKDGVWVNGTRILTRTWSAQSFPVSIPNMYPSTPRIPAVSDVDITVFLSAFDNAPDPSAAYAGGLGCMLRFVSSPTLPFSPTSVLLRLRVYQSATSYFNVTIPMRGTVKSVKMDATGGNQAAYVVYSPDPYSSYKSDASALFSLREGAEHAAFFMIDGTSGQGGTNFSPFVKATLRVVEDVPMLSVPVAAAKDLYATNGAGYIDAASPDIVYVPPEQGLYDGPLGTYEELTAPYVYEWRVRTYGIYTQQCAGVAIVAIPDDMHYAVEKYEAMRVDYTLYEDFVLWLDGLITYADTESVAVFYQGIKDRVAITTPQDQKDGSEPFDQEHAYEAGVYTLNSMVFWVKNEFMTAEMLYKIGADNFFALNLASDPPPYSGSAIRAV